MAFISATPIFTKKNTFAAKTCTRMNASPADNGAIQPTIPRFTKVPLKRGDVFPFVRFFVDDFEPSPYFQNLTGKGIRVAVLDTGCDKNHPALRNRIDFGASKNYSSGDPNAWDDENGHGTHCAGIIAAENIGEVMHGVAPEAEIIVKKILPRGNIAQAVRDAVNENCRVISMSFGYNNGRGFFNETLSEMYLAMGEALAKGVVLVAAAGNDGRITTNNSIDPPGSYGGIITVASHDDTGRRSRFSSYGGELDFMAPGEVISTYPSGRYQALQGTSMACPLVAGLAALLLEAGDRSNLSGLSDALQGDIRRTGFRGRNAFEVHEMLRFLAERPNEHSRLDGYGALSRAYQVVKGEVDRDL